MKISTRTVVVLDETDIQDAIIAWVKSNPNLATFGEFVDVELKSDPISAILSIVSDGEGGDKPAGKPVVEKTTRRTRKSTVTADANQEPDNRPTAVSQEKDEEKATEEPEVTEETAGEQLPWDGEVRDGEGKPIAVAAPATIGTSIFPNATSSAAPTTPKPEAPANVKSLFANLGVGKPN